MDFTHVLSIILVLILSFTERLTESKECDWEIWDDAWQGRGVKRVDVSCNKGRISWQGPYGGIYITVQGPPTEYQVCIQAQNKLTSAIVMRVEKDSMEKVLQLIQEDSQASKSTVCLSATNEMVLFVEPSIGASVSSEIIIDYDLELSPKYGEDECRPCTDEELLWNYCTSDFVAVGRMLAIRQSAADTILPVQIDYVKQQSAKYFQNSLDKPGKLKGDLYAPAKCGMKYGSGQFVFMGKFKFGRAELRCAPTVEDYTELQRTSKLKGTLLCT